MADKIAHDTKKMRTSILIEQGERKRRAFYEKNLNRLEEVLVEQKNKEGDWTGYTSNYIPVMVEDDRQLHNKIVGVRLDSVEGKRMWGIVDS
jgi:threonylcarbamoyladenosine tRNA methylthiotransferase MtaB